MYEMYCTNLPKVFTFDAIAKEYLDELNEEYILEMNRALLSGEIPPKSKKIDIATRLSVSIHCLETIIGALLKGEKPPVPSEFISKDALAKAVSFVEFVNTQKEILPEVIISTDKIILK